jgi:hypothetical protein
MVSVATLLVSRTMFDTSFAVEEGLDTEVEVGLRVDDDEVDRVGRQPAQNGEALPIRASRRGHYTPPAPQQPAKRALRLSSGRERKSSKARSLASATPRNIYPLRELTEVQSRPGANLFCWWSST